MTFGADPTDRDDPLAARLDEVRASWGIDFPAARAVLRVLASGHINPSAAVAPADPRNCRRPSRSAGCRAMRHPSILGILRGAWLLQSRNAALTAEALQGWRRPPRAAVTRAEL